MSIYNKILKENALIHDQIALDHDQNVPYINNKKCRNYYKSLIYSEIPSKKNGKIKNILELGCGTGTFAEIAIEQNAKYVGVDLSSNMIKLANDKHKSIINSSNYSIEFICENLKTFAVKYNGDKFDLIISSSFLHHMYDLSDSLVDINHLLNEDGVYVGLHEPILPHRQTLTNKLDKIFSIFTGNYFGELNFFYRLLMIFFGYFLEKPDGSKGNYFSLLNLKNLILFRFSKISKKINVKDEIDYVDYQLNSEFDLRNIKFKENYKNHINVKPYNFSVFSFFRRVDKLNLNYCLLVMNKFK